MKTPKPHQTKAVKAVVSGFESHDRGKLIMACGTGKTLIAGWVRQKMKAGCTLFMAPSNALLAQTLQAWRETAETPFEALAVCCDASVAQGRDDDDMPAANVGATVTTDYQQIANFISSTGERVVFCTYQSGEALAAAMSLVSVPQFDLAIADEAHRTTGGADHLFPSIVHKDKIRAAKRLFMTATPRFYFDNGVDEIVSMDDEELYGPTFHELDFAEAIKLGLLTDYEILVVGVSPEHEKEAVKLIKKNPHLKVADRKLAARDIAVNIAVLRAIKELGLERVITFHSSCPKAQAASDFLPKLQDWMLEEYRTGVKLWARTVNHTLNIGERHDLMRQFVALDGPGVLTNCRCLGEGVDVPTVDAIAFMDPKKSKIEIAQSVGRAIRLSPGKKKSYVIVPVIMLPGDDQKQVHGKKFKPAMDVINALRSHDSTLMDQLQRWKDSDRGGIDGGSGGAVDDGGRKITFKIPPDCDPAIARWFITILAGARLDDRAWSTRSKEVEIKLTAGAPLTAEELKWAKEARMHYKAVNTRSNRMSSWRREAVKKWIDAMDAQYPSKYISDDEWLEKSDAIREKLLTGTKLTGNDLKWAVYCRASLRLKRGCRLSDVRKRAVESWLNIFNTVHQPKQHSRDYGSRLLSHCIKHGFLPQVFEKRNTGYMMRAIRNTQPGLFDKLVKFQTETVFKRTSRVRSYADALDKYVSQHGHLPSRSDPKYGPARVWLYSANKSSRLFGVRTATWWRKMMQIPCCPTRPQGTMRAYRQRNLEGLVSELREFIITNKRKPAYTINGKRINGGLRARCEVAVRRYPSDPLAQELRSMLRGAGR